MVDEDSALVSGVDEGEGAEGVSEGNEDCDDDEGGFFLACFELLSCDDGEAEEHGGDNEIVARGFGGFFVLVDGVVDLLGCGADDFLGGFSGDDGGEGEEGSDDEEGEGCVHPFASAFFVDDAEEHGDPRDEQQSEGEVDDEGVQAFVWGEWRE